MNKQTLKQSNGNIVLTERETKQRLKQVEKAYGKFLTELGYEWENDANMQETPKRVAKMYIKETAVGNFTDKPRITIFDNVDKYDGMVFQSNIDVKSQCSHHMMPFFGKAHVAYIAHPDGKIIGLSKLNRIVDWFARRPQVQENLTMQIHDFLDNILKKHQGIAVKIEALHTCVALRGVNQNSSMQTTKLSGAFTEKNGSAQLEFFENINRSKRL